MAVLAFILFIEITVQRAAGLYPADETAGLFPQDAEKILNRFFLPWLSSAVFVAAIVALGCHIFLIQWLKKMELQLGISDAWILPVLLLVILVLLWLLLRRSVSRILNKI